MRSYIRARQPAKLSNQLKAEATKDPTLPRNRHERRRFGALRRKQKKEQARKVKLVAARKARKSYVRIAGSKATGVVYDQEGDAWAVTEDGKIVATIDVPAPADHVVIDGETGELLRRGS